MLSMEHALCKLSNVSLRIKQGISEETWIHNVTNKKIIKTKLFNIDSVRDHPPELCHVDFKRNLVT